MLPSALFGCISFTSHFRGQGRLQGVLAAVSTDFATVVLGRVSSCSRSEGAQTFEDRGREVTEMILGRYSQDSFITAVEASDLCGEFAEKALRGRDLIRRSRVHWHSVMAGVMKEDLMVLVDQKKNPVEETKGELPIFEGSDSREKDTCLHLEK